MENIFLFIFFFWPKIYIRSINARLFLECTPECKQKKQKKKKIIINKFVKQLEYLCKIHIFPDLTELISRLNSITIRQVVMVSNLLHSEGLSAKLT